jgi:predicted Rdx family selenoprotein
MGRFPEIAELKQCVRDAIAPDKDLGCIDSKKSKGS